MPAADRVTVIVPTYNEIESLEDAAAGVLAHGYRLLVVDDGSPDGTGRLADGLAREHPSITVLHRDQKRGLGTAYAEGFEMALDAGADILCEMDADLSHDPAVLPQLVAAVEAGADLAIGSRMVEGGSVSNWSLPRRMLSRWGNRYARAMLGVPTRDLTSGFRAFRAAALRRLDPGSCLANGYGFQIEMAWRAHRAGMTVTEVPFTFVERTHGKSKLSGRITLEAMWLVTRWGVERLLGRGGS
ncbi:MAG TPA: polyprenol monophosphomannose synthase [Acidimicrobiia bacterium]|nr:polyprenol monophosphomannose synthase [Acidimicrobiia bacterium]